jgi:uncharacterized integral membrane protein (TIGR00698 family)
VKRSISSAGKAAEHAPAGQNKPRWIGIVLTAAIAASAFGLRQLPGFDILSPLIMAILLGMAFHNLLGTPASAKSGVKFSLGFILRAGIVLLGLQLTFAQVVEVGWIGALVIIATLASTFVFTIWFGRVLGVDRKLTQLIAAGTSICGASAVIATNTVTRGSDEDVAYAVACVTVFGSLAMVLIPIAEGFLGLGPKAYGLWAGASIHEVAQVVAAAFQQGDAAGHFGTIAKLTRVMLLAPLVLILGVLSARHVTSDPTAKTPVPWFVLGFVAMVGVASTGLLPEGATHAANGLTQFLLAMALAAMGLETDVRKLAAEGIRPALLGAISWFFILGTSLVLVLATESSV